MSIEYTAPIEGERDTLVLLDYHRGRQRDLFFMTIIEGDRDLLLMTTIEGDRENLVLDVYHRGR